MIPSTCQHCKARIVEALLGVVAIAPDGKRFESNLDVTSCPRCKTPFPGHVHPIKRKPA